MNKRKTKVGCVSVHHPWTWWRR